MRDVIEAAKFLATAEAEEIQTTAYHDWDMIRDVAKTLVKALENPPKHVYWRPGEPGCPREIKAGNGELHTLRCKVCGLDNPLDDFCRAALVGPMGRGGDGRQH